MAVVSVHVIAVFSMLSDVEMMLDFPKELKQITASSTPPKLVDLGFFYNI